MRPISPINTANRYTFMDNKRITKNKLQEKKDRIDQKENNDFPQQRKPNYNMYNMIKEEVNKYYGINSDYDEYYDEEVSDNDEYIPDNSENLNLYDDMLKDMLNQQMKEIDSSNNQ